MQTYLVHMRAPRRLWRELGARRFLGLQVLMGGLILSALVHPWFYVLVAYGLWQGQHLGMPDTVWGKALLAVGLFNMVAGYVSAMALGIVSAARRGRLRLAAHALVMPIYWLGISVGAYRALVELILAPHYWEKTEHFAASERITSMPARSKVQQEAAGIALAAKRGEFAVSKLKGASRSMYESMSESQLEEFAGTKRKGLPQKKGAAKS